MCEISSMISPEPLPPPRILGICMKIMVVEIPLMKPPITGVDM